MVLENLLFTKGHEWIKINENQGLVGLTAYAQESLGDVVFVELPLPNEEFNRGESFGIVESVKTVADLYMPVKGKVIAVNEDVLESPELINDDPYGKGWLIKMEIHGSNDNLLTAEEYAEFLESKTI